MGFAGEWGGGGGSGSGAEGEPSFPADSYQVVVFTLAHQKKLHLRHGYFKLLPHQKKKKPSMVLKLDFRKAYDSVNWTLS